MPEPTLSPSSANDVAVPAASTTAAAEKPATINRPAEDLAFGDIKVGDVVQGVRIDSIIVQVDEAIVFTDAGGSLHFWHELGEQGNQLLVEFSRITSKRSARLSEAYRHPTNRLIGAAMAEALGLPPGADIRAPFKAADAFIDARGPVPEVFGFSGSWVVFCDKDEVICEYPAVSQEAAPLLTEFYRLQQLAKASLPADESRALNKILGTELSIALQRTPAPSIEDAFSASRDYIQLRNESRMRALYISASLSAAVIFGLACWALIRTDLGLLLGCVGGIIGATISVLQRSATLEIRRFLPRAQVAIQGGVRITLGVLFGLLIVAAARADVALGTFASSANSLFLAGVAAGFSERFIPDLLTKITSESDPSSAAKPATK